VRAPNTDCDLARNLLLLLPPLTDPTCGSAALPALASWVRASGRHTIVCRDLNIESIQYLLQPGEVGRTLARAQRELEQRTAGHAFAPLSADSLAMRLVDLNLASTLEAEDPLRAASIFRDPIDFYDYHTYYWAATTLKKWLGVLAPPEYPRLYANFCIRENIAEVNLRNLGQLLDPVVLERVTGPFAPYIERNLVASVRNGGHDVVGLSVGFHDQLPFAVKICRAIRAHLPEVSLVLGGAGISQVWKFGAETGATDRVLTEVDAVVIGDGEPAIVEILDALDSGASFAEIPNTVCPENADRVPPRRYIDLGRLSAPTVEDLPLDTYLSPVPTAHYALTRGCYWNRCAFCDYGLSEEAPTSPWRQRNVDAVLSDLRHLSRFARFVYFSVDAIAPAYLRRVAEAILDAGLEIRWGAEIRLDALPRPKYFELLRASGCVAVSVGFESGSQRILDLMDKGTTVDRAVANIKGLAKAGIAVQIMGFTGFPSETFEEAMHSIGLLGELEGSWVFGGLGAFQLTAGARVAQRPGAFGIQNLRFRPHDDVQCLVDFDEVVVSKTPQEVDNLAEAVKALRLPYQLARPFAGGTDTAHTYLYLERYGFDIRSVLAEALFGPSFDDSRYIVLAGVVADWWPTEVSVGGPAGGAARVIRDDGTVFECGVSITALARQLGTPRTMADHLDSLMSRRAVEQAAALGAFRQLISSGLVRGLPYSAAASRSVLSPGTGGSR